MICAHHVVSVITVLLSDDITDINQDYLSGA